MFWDRREVCEFVDIPAIAMPFGGTFGSLEPPESVYTFQRQTLSENTN